MGVNIRIRNGLEPDGGGNGGATEGDVRGNHTDIIQSTEGVVDLSGGHLLVHEAAVPAMTVVVDKGVGYIPNDSFDEDDSDSIKFWEGVVSGTTASRTLTIGANSSGQTRVDLACLKIDPGATPDQDASDIAELIVVAGTPGAGAPATPSYYLKLAEVTVLNGAVSITNAKIADSRTQVIIKPAVLPIDTDGTLAANSDSKIATQKAVKTYADTKVPKTTTVNGHALSSNVSVSASDVGLGNVDNTSDATKNAASVTLTNKTLTSPVVNSPTGIVKGDISLGNVDNTSDSTKNAAAVTLTNKRITKRVDSIASSTTPTPDADADDVFLVTALAAGATFGAPSGTPTSAQGLVIRIKDNGTARTLAWNSAYRAVGVILPTTTVISKTIYLGMLYNSADSKWDVIAVQSEV